MPHAYWTIRTGRAAGDISYDSVKSIRSVRFIQTLSALLIVLVRWVVVQMNTVLRQSLGWHFAEMLFLTRAFSSGLISNNQLWHYCAHFCKDVVIIEVFIKNSSNVLNMFVIFFDKHSFWRICVGTSVHWWMRPHLSFCVVLRGHFRMSHFKGGLLSLECSWIQHEFNLN
jgi:hypothetical protein